MAKYWNQFQPGTPLQPGHLYWDDKPEQVLKETQPWDW